ncbi:MAG TPA: Ig-like domain-containing protein [Roseiflexaceae bacterium]|jgi:fibronectin type 3 domain-containing protein|nr:Ig-like domain-containing protein [Roseiflexaceae bacterium]
MKTHRHIAPMLLISILFLFTGLLTVHKVAAMPAPLLLPFQEGETWYVCQGYRNSNGSHTIDGFALDLSIDRNSPGIKGCNPSTANSSTGKTVVAPGSGKAYRGTFPDSIYINFDAGGSVVLGHLRHKWQQDAPANALFGHVSAGEAIGIVNPPGVGNNGGYAHIHIHIKSGYWDGGTQLPFAAAYQTRFQCAPDMPDKGKDEENQYSGLALTRCWSQSPDTTPPTGSITAPIDGSSTKDSRFTITANASDSGSGVRFVDFYIRYDGSWKGVCRDETAPYECQWDASNIVDQRITFTIHVHDNAGNITMDPGGYHYVTLDRTPPTGSIISPIDGSSTRNSQFTITANASDSGSGVDYVIFTAFYDGNWHTLYTDNAAPYEYTWNVSGIADQEITLGFDVYDKAGHRAASPQGTRHIIKDATAPTGGYTEPAAGVTVSDKVTLRGTASDNLSGVDHVNFTALYDGSWHILYTDSTAPYEYNWDVSGIADQGITLGYDIYDKAGNVALAPQGTRQITKAQGLLAPSNVQELSSSQNRITLQWQDKSNNEDGFHIYRWRGEDLSWLLIGTVAANQTSFSDINVGCGSDYAYYVVAFNAAGESEAEPWITAGTYPCPATNLRIGTVTDDTIEVQWDATGTLDGFRIYRDFTNKDRSKVVIDELIGTVGADARSFVMTGAECEGEYLLRADPYHGSKQTTDYIYASYDMPLCAPSGLQAANVTSNSVTLNWQDNSYKGHGYNIYKWNSSIGDWDVLTTVAAHSTEATFTNLACDTTFYYEVKAYDSDHVSETSGWIAVTTGACAATDPSPEPTSESPVLTPTLPPTATPTTQPTSTSTPAPGTPEPTPGTEPQSDQHQIFLPLLGR